MSLVEISRTVLESGMVELVLSDGVDRLTLTIPSDVDNAPDMRALVEVMFNQEQQRLAVAKRASRPGQPL